MNRKRLLVTFAACAGVCIAQQGLALHPRDSIPQNDVLTALEQGAPFSQKQTDGNATGLVISNYGFFGNNFVTRSPSMEYPLGSQIEHLIRAGVWVGAINADGDTVVSTGAISGYWGTSTASATEFTPQQTMKERSTLITSRSYSKDAISEQDFVTWYTDYPRRGTNRSVLRVSVSQASYLWSYRFAEAFVIVSFTIRNDGEGILRDPCLGLFAELSSGWKGAYDTWRPPSSAWFKNKMLEYFPDQRMCAEHHFNYQVGTAPSWGALAILGTKNTTPIDQVHVSFNWWDWYWERDHPMEDPDRYALMRNRETDVTDDITPGADDPVEMISAGPFPEMASGDSIVFVCAFLGGMDREHLIQNAEWAQRAFDNDYILPSPPQPPRFRIKPTKSAITILWDDLPESELDPFYQIPDFEGYRIYVTRKEGATSEEFDLVRELDVIDSIGYDTGFESVRDSTIVVDTLYTYRMDLTDVKDGFKYWLAITAFDKGLPEEGVESMESGIRATKALAIPGTPPTEDDETIFVVPNPYRGEAVWDGTRDREKYLWFVNLPQRATIRVYTLAGDLVKTIEFDGTTYDAGDIQGLKTSAERFLAIPGGICAWDLISDEDQAVGTGLYIYSVENKRTGANQIGKFMIIR
jgi:hypothetical protein